MVPSRAWPTQSVAQAALLTALFGLMGAFLWAIRGTAGYGGSDGGTLAGLGWGILWLAMSGLDGNGVRRPYGGPRVLVAITLGIAFGGMTGYGVYIAWIQGKFYLDYPEGVRVIAPWTGYAMLFLCGLHWGGVTGALVSWCAPRRPVGWRGWAARITAGIAGAVLAGVIVRIAPQLFLPFYGEGLYDIQEYRTCRRALESIRNIAPHVGLYFGFLACELMRRDRRAVAMMLMLGLGFAIPFTIGGYWHTFHGSSLQLDWWKNWEMSIGLGGGMALGVAFLLLNRPGAMAQTVSLPERIVGGLVLWLGSSSVLSGSFDGLVKLHGLERFRIFFDAIVWVWFLATAGLLIWWARQRPAELAAPFVPNQALVGVMMLIIVCGFAVSVPLPMQFNSKVLLGLYALYVAASIATLLALRAALPPRGSVSG